MQHARENILEVRIESVRKLKRGLGGALVSGIEFAVAPGEIVAIVGKNGAGKSTILNCILKLNDGRELLEESSIKFYGEELSTKSGNDLAAWRREKIAFVPQNPSGSFDPLKKISYYFDHLKAERSAITELFGYFLLGNPGQITELYPHQISGGMAQRILIVLALLKNPSLMILDEPNSAVDLPVSNLISARLKSYTREKKKAVLFITQNSKFAFNTADRILVLGTSGLAGLKNISSAGELENFIAGTEANG